MGLWTDIVGSVRGYIRLGLTGVRLKNSSGALAVRNAGDSAYANVECGDLYLGPGNKLVFEGTTDDTYETTVDPGNPTADRTLTLPNKSGTVATTDDVSIVPTIQTFTSGGTWTKPAGLKYAIVELVGGGGGGGGGASGGNISGGGGGAGGYARKIILAASLGSSETVTIGAAGSGGSAGSNGTAGGTTSFGSHCSATGGGAGITSGGGGAGGVGSGGNVNTAGQGGQPAALVTVSTQYGGHGGTSYFGGGGTSGGASGVYGGGGSGGTGSGAGGNGSAGIVVVTEYY